MQCTSKLSTRAITILNIYKNDFDNSTNYSDIHHFTDDTNLLYSSKSIKGVNEKINFDLKNIVHWLRANKISLNTNRTEINLFRTKKQKLKKEMNFEISGQKTNIVKEAKYLGLKLDQHLPFKQHMDTVILESN